MSLRDVSAMRSVLASVTKEANEIKFLVPTVFPIILYIQVF